MYDVIVENARLYPMAGDAGLSAARSFAVRDGLIAALPADGPARQRIDARGRVVLPGLVDCHTHALFAGDRSAEHRRRLAGASYETIAREGGGIAATVRSVRAATEAQLVDESLPRVAALMDEGVTTIEIKSGYGLDTAGELKMLRAIRRLGEQVRARVVPTFLGAHAIPPGESADAFVDLVIDDMLPLVAAQELASAVDLYVESIAFDVGHLERIFSAAEATGLGKRVHAGQFSAMGACAAAARHGALSCDHLEYMGAGEATAMAAAGCVAVMLPGAWYFLRETQRPPVSQLRQRGVRMAVATDLNPGSSPVASLLTALHMAVNSFELTPAEALLGVTLHAAAALGRDHESGSLEPGKHADFTLWPLEDPAWLAYQLGGIRPDAVYVGGQKR
ncbi:MAG: imidazolonepropionase [Gammaproteobacteria bacterium]|nr:imidazolonepropionase [Gammaproteobacteria bacterium]